MAKSNHPESLPDGTPIVTYRNGERLEGTILWQATDTYSVLIDDSQDIRQFDKRECEESQ